MQIGETSVMPLRRTSTRLLRLVTLVRACRITSRSQPGRTCSPPEKRTPQVMCVKMYGVQYANTVLAVQKTFTRRVTHGRGPLFIALVAAYVWARVARPR